MLSSTPLVYRKSVLSNPAAEFVEQKAGVQVLEQLEIHGEEAQQYEAMTEFVPELDRFAARGTSAQLLTRIYQDAEQSLRTFQQTLIRFVALLNERKIGARLGVVIKSPTDPGFDIDYALHIISKIEEEGENITSGSVRSCKMFVRKWYQKVADNKPMVDSILKMIPNDSYGALISGGVALILAAVEKQVKERENIHKFLAEIPERLDRLHRLFMTYNKSQRMHMQMNAVLVSVFVVLERIIDKITDTWTQKIMKHSANLKAFFKPSTKLKCNPTIPGNCDDTSTTLTITQALQHFRDLVQRFEEEVQVCGHERLASVVKGVENTSSQNNDLVSTCRDVVKEAIDALKSSETERWALLKDCLYVLFDRDRLDTKKESQRRRETVSPAPVLTPQSRRKENKMVAKRWLKEFKEFRDTALVDMRDCLDHMEQLGTRDKNVAQEILDSEELNSWLMKKKSCTFLIDQETPHSDLVNPLSFTSALLAITLRSTKQFPILSFFCMHRNNQSTKKDVSGPLALVQSLNGQLLDFICEHRPHVNLAELENEDVFDTSLLNYRTGLDFFSQLLSILPKGDMVIIILDTLSFLSGSDKRANRILKTLGNIMERHKHLVIKFLVTDPLAGSPAYKMAGISLHAQDAASGSGVIDVEVEEKQIKKRCKKYGRASKDNSSE
ncbi:hypothetical protein QBC41DRAFT_300461 [Cercophora samala]|uniref:Uncharacterized protein n=1 Tax=Cercophora samala TaxID=330535 RepID=A0AA39ZI76_9PEZI|nr:hypothetical protein QBC41DRAFT_300461 [Cercophora samala]